MLVIAEVVDLVAIPVASDGICLPVIPEADVKFDLDLATPGCGILDGLGEAVRDWFDCPARLDDDPILGFGMRLTDEFDPNIGFTKDEFLAAPFEVDLLNACGG